MKKKYQVFISSTYIDLKDERQAAVEAILSSGHIPAGMELFCASNDSQWKVIERWIDDSDIFLLILGGRYGSIEPKSEKSYVQLEYEYAERKGKIILPIVISDDFLKQKSSKLGKFVIEESFPNLYSNFKESVLSSKLVSFFNGYDEIKIAVLKSIKKIEERYGDNIMGWISESILQDIIKLHIKAVCLDTANGSIEEHTEAINSVPINQQYKCYYARGITYLSIGQIYKAIDDFNSAISRNTIGLNLSEVNYYLAISYLRLGDYKNAFKNHKTYLELEREKGNYRQQKL